MAFYIKVTKTVSDKLGLTEIRNRTADGNVLLWQADISSIKGNTIIERASKVGGICLLPQQAKVEIDGTNNPVEVSTPPEYENMPDEEIPDELTPSDLTNEEEVLS